MARSDVAFGGTGLPRHVRRELEGFLSCGILCRGFVRVYCDSCHDSMLVAFSCKARAVCPSCTGRRMAEVSAHLVDHVLPEVPIRQWVLSLPHNIRFLLIRDAELCQLVRGVFIRAVQSFYIRRARDQGHPDGRCGAVVCTQRFDSSLRLDLHWHSVVLDGVYTGFGLGESLTFHQATPLSDEEVEGMVHHIHALIVGQLRRLGHLDDEGELGADAGDELGTLGTLHAAAIQGVIPFGPRAGLRTRMCGDETPPKTTPRPKKELCADHLGFSLHAAVRIGAGNRSRLARIVRYITRPPIAQSRLSLTKNGDILYRFRNPWRNG
ncbi:MAG: transposase, partial [bacterium]|nr:transposase [bacterium]